MSKPARESLEVFDRDLLRRRRDRAAAHVPDFDFLLRDVADALMERLGLVKKNLPVIADIGSYHGVLSSLLQQRLGTETVISTDISYQMAKQSPAESVVADEEFLPFGENTLDAVLSNLSLHWVNDLPGTLLQIRQSLKEDGVFMAALLGGNSLTELRQSLMAAELAVQGGASPRVSPFIDTRDMGALMQRAGFSLPVVDSETITVDYPHALKLMHDLRGMGGSNATYNRLMRPTRRGVLLEAAKIYQEKFGTAQGTIPASFQVVYAIGWKPHESQQKPLKPGTARVKLADALETAEVSTDDLAKP